jgi:hypothetical protein
MVFAKNIAKIMDVLARDESERRKKLSLAWLLPAFATGIEPVYSVPITALGVMLPEC